MSQAEVCHFTIIWSAMNVINDISNLGSNVKIDILPKCKKKKKDGYARTSCTQATQGTYLPTPPSSKRTHYESGATRISPHGSRPHGLLRPSEGAPLFAQVLQIPPLLYPLSHPQIHLLLTPPPHQPGVITPAPPQFPNWYPPTSHTPYPTHPPTTEPHNMDRDSWYLG